MRPDAFAAVMATGIVAIATQDHGFERVSAILAAVSVVLFAVLVVAAVARLRPDFGDIDVPIQLLTFVAACAVVATRLNWWPLSVVGLVGWLALMPLVFRDMWRHRWTCLRDRARGGGELVSVATSGLAIVAADFGFVHVALGALALAICLYCVMTILVLWRVAHDPGAPALYQPDMWILMGGAAIATLAGDHIHHAGVEEIWPVTVVTWIVASAWIPVLVAASVRLRDGNWWAMVFPLGMYSSASYATAVEMGWQWLTALSLTFMWIALAAWLVTTALPLLRFRRDYLR